MEDIQKRIDNAYEELKPDLTRISLAIHSHPELAMNEFFAHDLLTAYLATNGFSIEDHVASLPTAFTASFGSGRPVVAILCEYDALPGIGHGCGHNLIAAGGVTAAVALSRVLNPPPGTIRVIGTPGEEGAGGKILELDAGVFSDVDVSMMFHPMDYTIMERHASALIPIGFEFTGKSAHAAANPDQGRSALAGVIQLFNALDSLRQFLPEETRIHGVITDGGQAPAVIPAHAAASFLVRAATLPAAEELLERVKACARAAALATGTRVRSSRGLAYAERNNNHALATRVGHHLVEMGLSIDTPALSRGQGSSDIGNVSLVMPTIHPYLGIAPAGTPGHSVAMRKAARQPRAHQLTAIMARALAKAAAELLLVPQFLAAVQAEFQNSCPQSPNPTQ